jgi:hypothetical protein
MNRDCVDSADAIRRALSMHPDCSYADWANGMDYLLTVTIVVKLWRNEECYLAGDPPKYVEEGYRYRSCTCSGGEKEQ